MSNDKGDPFRDFDDEFLGDPIGDPPADPNGDAADEVAPYSVGYRKPPKQHQFKKDQSGKARRYQLDCTIERKSLACFVARSVP